MAREMNHTETIATLRSQYPRVSDQTQGNDLNFLVSLAQNQENLIGDLRFSYNALRLRSNRASAALELVQAELRDSK